MKSLREIEACFQGVIPGYLATASSDGVPNIALLSVVHLLDDRRVGLSYQFFRKSIANLKQTQKAQLLLTDPTTLIEYRLNLRFVGVLEAGPVFERMDTQLAGIASQTGMEDVFRLAGVVECDVLDWERVGGVALEQSDRPSSSDALERLERVAASIESASDLEALLDRTFEALASQFGFDYGFMLLADGDEERLYTVASHGFGEARFGAEIAFGEGIYGNCAQRRQSCRYGSLSRSRLMSSAVARESAHSAHELPLPGLAEVESTLAVPVVHGDRCLGVLCLQHPQPAAFREQDERALSIVARHLAAMIHVLGAMQEQEQELQLSGRRGPLGSRALATRVKYYESDGSVFFDDEYLIKGVAGRVLWRVLSAYVNEQRDEFSNKEIRLASDIGLPAFRDNLEARLITLRRRLAERGASVRLERAGRGRFRIEVERELLLERLP